MSSSDAAPELLVGVEGLALLRGLHEPGQQPAAARRLAEVRELLAGQPPGRAPIAEADLRTGYAHWSGSYDQPGNPIVELEQPIVWTMLAGVAPGRALDAGCGTGRHTRRLADLGHTVIGVDLTPEMLALAHETVPEATLREGDLRSLPVDGGAIDVAVCALAIGHLPDPAPAIAELARVLAPGGELVISVLHPIQVHLGWHAMFTDRDGHRGFVREHPHGHAAYLRAFRKAELEVVDCVEPTLGQAHVQTKRRLFAAIPEATVQAYAGLPAVVVWRLRRAG